MVPILFAATETAFTSNGLGRLADATKCEVTEERNGVYELVMEYPVNGKMYDQIECGKYIYATHDEGKVPQAFQIYKVSTPIEGVITVNAWHISYALNTIIVAPFTAVSCTAAIAGVKTNSMNTNPFTFWTDKSVTADFETTLPMSARAILGGTQGSILDVYGKGEYEFDMYTVKLHLNRGANRGVSIRYGKNLTQLDQTLDASNVYNSCVPYWTNGEVSVVSDVIITKAGQTTGRTIAMDLSNEFDEQPTLAELKAKAQTKIDVSDSYTLKENLKIDFVALWQTEEYKSLASLQRIYLCDTVNIFYEKAGINVTAQCIKVVYDSLRERYVSMELGEPSTSLIQQIQHEVIGDVMEQVPSKSQMQAAIDKATELIGGGFGGYIKFNYLSDGTPSEMLVMDSPSESTATNIIRLNQNGLGFSTDGGTTYANAWTIDGNLNASFITTGVLNANLLTAGMIQDTSGENYWNLDTGQFVTKQGEIAAFTIDANGLTSGTVGADSDGVTIDANRWYSTNVQNIDGNYFTILSRLDRSGLHLGIVPQGSAIVYATTFNLVPTAYNGVRCLEFSVGSTVYARIFREADGTPIVFMKQTNFASAVTMSNNLTVRGSAQVDGDFAVGMTAESGLASFNMPIKPYKGVSITTYTSGISSVSVLNSAILSAFSSMSERTAAWFEYNPSVTLGEPFNTGSALFIEIQKTAASYGIVTAKSYSSSTGNWVWRASVWNGAMTTWVANYNTTATDTSSISGVHLKRFDCVAEIALRGASINSSGSVGTIPSLYRPSGYIYSPVIVYINSQYKPGMFTLEANGTNAITYFNGTSYVAATSGTVNGTITFLV